MLSRKELARAYSAEFRCRSRIVTFVNLAPSGNTRLMIASGNGSWYDSSTQPKELVEINVPPFD